MRRRFHAKRKRVVRWFCSSDAYLVRGTAGFVVTNTPGDLGQATLALHARNASPTPDLVERDQRHTLDAIRGQILLRCDPALSDADAMVHLGIGVVDVTASLGGDKKDPGDPADAPWNWMWLHHTMCPRSSAPDNFWQPSIDVHVKTRRVMKDNEALVLFMSVDAVPGTLDPTAVAIVPYLRLLVSHGE